MENAESRNKKIAIITARGGSKRIPRKNIKEFCGRPIIEYSIEAALECGIFDEVMVSTDDNEIAEVAKKAGANVPFMRSAEMSDDHATTSDVLMEVLLNYQAKGDGFISGCCIYPTAPFVTAAKLRRAMGLLEQEAADTVIPVVAYSFPPQRGMYIEGKKLRLSHPEYRDRRSQDLETIYHDCGQFYAFRIMEFLQKGVLIGENMIPMVMDEMEVQDIDNETDWRLAEIKYRFLTGRGE